VGEWTGRIGGETHNVVMSLNLRVVEMEKHTMGSLIALKCPSLNLLTVVATVTWQIYKYHDSGTHLCIKENGCVWTAGTS